MNKPIEEYKNPGTHETHCCGRHGCKYGYECPVEDGVIVQSYLCEFCEGETVIREQIERLQEELEWVVELQKRIKDKNK